MILWRKEWQNDTFRFIENNVTLYKGYRLQTQSENLPAGTRISLGRAVHDEKIYGSTGLRIAHFDVWQSFNYHLYTRYSIYRSSFLKGKLGSLMPIPVRNWYKIHGNVKVYKHPSIPPGSTSIEVFDTCKLNSFECIHIYIVSKIYNEPWVNEANS